MSLDKVYTFHSDAGHGWLSVKRVEVIALGLIDKISHYSYQKGATVYLEEDCDASLFLNAYNNHFGIEAKVKSGKHVAHSPIRSYDSFKILA